MDVETDGRKGRERSPRFPFISLERALDRAATFYAAEKRGAAPFEAAAEHCRRVCYSRTIQYSLHVIINLVKCLLGNPTNVANCQERHRCTHSHLPRADAGPALHAIHHLAAIAACTAADCA